MLIFPEKQCMHSTAAQGRTESMTEVVGSQRKRSHEELKKMLLRRMPASGKYVTAIKGLAFSRREEINKADNCLGKPSVAVIVQGTKHAIIGDREYRYTEGQYCITGVHVPSAFYVLNSSAEKPFLAVILDLDSECISRLATEMPPSPKEENQTCRGLSVGDADADLLKCFLRLVELLDKPEQIRIRAPLIIREIYYLLLIGPDGGNLRLLNTLGTQSNLVARAIAWLKDNYRSPLRVEELARQVNMAPSTFYRYFKEITGLSPLRFHKQMRLYEAQRLMLMENQKAFHASLAVGYESDTQFNREYKKLFGESPYRDTLRRRVHIQ